MISNQHNYRLIDCGLEEARCHGALWKLSSCMIIITTMSNHHHLIQTNPKRFRLPLQKALQPASPFSVSALFALFVVMELMAISSYLGFSSADADAVTPRSCTLRSVPFPPSQWFFVMGYHQPSKISLSSSPHWQMRQVYLLEHSALHLMSQPTQLVTALQWPNT